MILQVKKISLFLLLLLINQSLKAGEVLKIREGQEQVTFSGKHIEIFEDAGGSLKLEDINDPVYDSRFEKPKLEIPFNENLASTYWIRFKIESLPVNNRWVLELYDFSIDTFELYIPEGGKYNKISGGDHFPFANKFFWHKNFVYELPPGLDKSAYIYIKVRSGHYTGFVGSVRSFKKFSGYALSEYYFLALFYGIIVAMTLYNFFLFITVRNIGYFFYILFVLSIGFFNLCYDGLGFQFFWPNRPEFNSFSLPLATALMTIAALLHSLFFLPVKSKSITIFYVLIGAIILRIVVFVAGGLDLGGIYIPNLERFFYLIPFITGIYIYYRGYTPARYYLLGYGILHLSFLLVFLFNIGVFSNLGVVALIFSLSIALADRIKLLVAEKEEADNQLIKQLKEKEQLKDRVNQELELKVGERTKELVEKNRQLDTFIYKASHDIKGPLRSIIGLTTVGIKDVADPVTKLQFEEILKSTSRLDNILSNLLSMTKVREAKLEISKIDFNKIIKDILSNYEGKEEFKKIKTSVNIKINNDFYSDEKILTSIFKHLIDNAFKYYDNTRQQPEIRILVESNQNEAMISVEDNGVGIPAEAHKKIFDVFYKGSEISKGSGLGLPLVKISVDKLGGTLTMNSQPKQGTIFQIKVPQSKS